MATTASDEHPGIGPSRGRLDGKVAIVTGSESGIGRATARLFAHEGAQVVCADVAEGSPERTDALIARLGGDASFVLGDVTQKDVCNSLVQTAVDRYGQLDVLFNNVGGAAIGTITEIDESQWQAGIDLTLTSVFHGMRAALPYFIERGHGIIVNNASGLGLLATDRRPIYCSAKAAVINLTRQTALDYGPNIRINCICPGATATSNVKRRRPEEVPLMGQTNRAMKRLARPEEIAYAVLFLASDESSFVTGHALVADGGQTIDA